MKILIRRRRGLAKYTFNFNIILNFLIFISFLFHTPKKGVGDKPHPPPPYVLRAWFKYYLNEFNFDENDTSVFVLYNHDLLYILILSKYKSC